MQQSLHVLDGCGERQRRNGRAVAVERQHVVASRRAIAEDEDLAPAFGTQVDEVVAGAAQEAGEIEVARLERELRPPPILSLPVQLTLYILLKKRGYAPSRQ